MAHHFDEYSKLREKISIIGFNAKIEIPLAYIKKKYSALKYTCAKLC